MNNLYLTSFLVNILPKLEDFMPNSENCLVAILPTKMLCCRNQNMVRTKKNVYWLDSNQTFCCPNQIVFSLNSNYKKTDGLTILVSRIFNISFSIQK